VRQQYYKLSHLFYSNLFLLFFSALIISGTVSYFVLKKIELTSIETMLKNSISIFEINLLKNNNLSSTVYEIKNQTGIRVTIIDAAGVVIAESHEDRRTMENHKNRPELLQAINNDYGVSNRFSNTLKHSFLYVAKKIQYENQIIFIRMAIGTQKIMNDFYELWLTISFIFGVTVLFVMTLAYRLNKNIENDVQKIKTNLTSLLKKEYDLTNDFSNILEFQVIKEQIKQVAKKLKKREKQKEKYTKKLRTVTERQADIISAISHEFKNPIAAIIGYSQTVLEDKEISENLRNRFLEKVIQNSQKISNLIDRLAMSAKFENEDLKPQYGVFALKKSLLDIQENLLQKHKSREIAIDIEDIKLKADKDMIENVFINLIDNALKYSEGTVFVYQHENTIYVKDEGIGISEKDLEKITRRFYRANAQSWDNSIGVGLYVVEYILKLHHIKLNIESTPGKGSVFSFDISEIVIS
jgi:signal transduction histidine kinase